MLQFLTHLKIWKTWPDVDILHIDHVIEENLFLLVIVIRPLGFDPNVKALLCDYREVNSVKTVEDLSHLHSRMALRSSAPCYGNYPKGNSSKT